MSSSAERRVLVVGTGSIGHRHTRCFLKVPGVSAAICEPNDAVRNDVAGRYSLIDAYRDYDSVPLDRFDAVVLCIPAPLHLPIAIRALDAGCHVLCEKPLSTTLDDVENVARAIERNNRVFRVAYTWRQHPGMKWIKEKVSKDPSAAILSAVIHTGQDFAFYRPAYREIYYARHETGGGAIQDAATHMIDLLQWFLGRVRSVHCTPDHLALDGVDVEDTVHLTLRFHDSAAIATVALNQFQKNNDCRVELAAKDFTLRLDLADGHVGCCRNEKWTFEKIPPRERDDNYIDQARTFLDLIDGKPSNLATLDEAAHDLGIVLAAFESAKTGRSIEISS